MNGNQVQLVVDGMTGVGKSTLVKILADEMDLVPFTEIFEDENNLLHKFFHDRERWCFPMQINFLNHRFRQYKEAAELGSGIMDRSVYSDNIFARMYREIDYMTPEEYNVYHSLLYNMIEHLDPPRLIIYLRVDAEEAIRRIKHRGRKDELEVEDGYWRKLHQFYEENYYNYKLGNIMTIDANNLDFVKYEEHRQYIISTVKNKWNEIRETVNCSN
ncbi:MAG: deoxynucleoside kinase [Clostridiales bacterium]|nr:deoxynucleoside kinase [Clostridiales bacterium]MCF8022972.1 deoxynucleoside kinase [Clostridiales bacterium]